MKRTSSAPGFSYVEANGGRVVTMEDDVLGVKRQIEETWPELSVYFDAVDELWLIVERRKDGVEERVMETKALSPAIMDTLLAADSHRGADPVEMMDKANAEREKRIDESLAERVHEAGERLAWAFARDGLTHRVKQSFALPNKPAPRLGIRG